MPEQYQKAIDWIHSQQEEMVRLLQKWSHINSGTKNLAGLRIMLSELKNAFAVLGGEMQEVSLPPRIVVDRSGNSIEEHSGAALLIQKYPDANFKVLLGGHMDTVYSAESPFQKTKRIDQNKLIGPGVTDMKGGLIVMLKALQALERSPFAGKIGWEVIINPDEEVGSPASQSLFIEAARRNDLGLLYEPSFSDGVLVSSRKGSANFTIVFRGKSAHAGRDFFEGKNAIIAAAKFALAIESLTNAEKGVTVNVGNFNAVGPVNIVPDLAIVGVNIRVLNSVDFPHILSHIKDCADRLNGNGISVAFHEHSARVPKPFDEKNHALFEKIRSCAKELGIDLKARPSGGVCDGNILSEQGLPTIDTLGVVGGNIHTYDEYILLDSLMERATLSALFLMKLANAEIVTKM